MIHPGLLLDALFKVIPLRHGNTVTWIRLQLPPGFLVYNIFREVNGWIELTLAESV